MLASQQVLQRVAQLLVAANTAAGADVHADRFHPVTAYPALRPRIVDEDLEADDDGEDVTWPRKRLHRLVLDVEAHQRAATGLDTALAALVAQVLVALEGTVAAATLQPLPGCSLVATGVRYQVSAEDEAATGKATVRFEVQFRTASNDPETII